MSQTNLYPMPIRRSVFDASPWRFIKNSSLATLLLAFAPIFASIALGTSSASADEPEIEVAVSAEELFVGESIDYQVEIKNVENPATPDVSALRDNFDVVANGDQSRNQSSTFIINGRVSQQNVFSHIYLYRLTPKVAGVLTIPSITITVDGTALTSKSLRLRVQDTEVQDLVIVAINSDHLTVYPTQPFTITVKVLVQPLPERAMDPLRPLRRQPPNLQVNWVDVPAGLTANEASQWLQPLMSADGTGFTVNDISASSGSFFGGARAAVFDLAKGRETKEGLDGKPIDYYVYELSRTFTPEKTGSYSLGPAIVKGAFVAGVRGTEYSARRIVAIAPAVTVEVREVPSPRPATYTGSIGDYQVAASASPLKLRVGDPLTLTLEFTKGKDAGSLELISAPELAAIPEVAEGFEIIDKSPTGRIEGSVKRFAYALRPKRPGVSIPALTLATFDPTEEKFKEVFTDAVTLEVANASKLSSGELVGSVPPMVSNGIQKSTAGIFQNITDPNELRDERVNLKGWVTTVAGFWFLAGCVMAGVTMHRHKSTDTVGQRRTQARRAAFSRLAEANRFIANGQQEKALRTIRSAFVGLVADTTNRVTEGLTTTDIASVLSDASVPDAERTSMLRLLESIEGAEYGAGDAIDAEAAIKSAASLIERVSPHLERSAGR